MTFDWWRDGALIYAAFVATIAVGLELRRWFESGARLDIVIMCPAVRPGSGGGDDCEYLAVTVANRGELATSITHFSLYEYPNMMARLRRRPAWSTLVMGYQILALPNLGPGQYWIGTTRYEGTLKDLAARGTLYVGISAMHYRKTILVRVKLAPGLPL